MTISAIYLSTSSFSVSGDRTLEFHEGRRIQADCGVDGFKYGTILSSSYSTVTTVNITGDSLTSNLETVKYGYIGVGNMHSLPNHSHDSSEGKGGFLDIYSYVKFLSQYSSLSSLVSDIGTNDMTIIIDKTETLTAPLTIPSNITLKFLRNGYINGAYTLTINGPIEAGKWKIFDLNTTVEGSPLIESVHVEWFGANGRQLYITDITQANPAVVTISSVDQDFIEDGDSVYINGVLGMTEINGTLATVINKSTNTFELSGVNSSAYSAYSSDGVIGIDNTSAINKSISFAEPSNALKEVNAIPLNFGPGTFRCTAGSLNTVTMSIDGKDATIAAGNSANAVLLSLNYFYLDRFRICNLHGLIGYDVSRPIDTYRNPTNKAGSGLYMGDNSSDFGRITIGCIYGFTNGIYLDGATNDVHIGDHVFNILAIAGCTYGIVLVGGASWPNEASEFNINFLDQCGTAAVYLGTNASNRVCSNIFNIQALELHNVAGMVGFNLVGANIYQNQFNVTGSLVPGTGNIVTAQSGAHDNIFRFCDIKWSLISQTGGVNIFLMDGIKYGYPTAVDTDQRSRVTSTSPPTASYWRIGDIFWNAAPSASGTIGWVCTTAGTPGTWKKFGTIAA